ncbi:GGDEF domain-containing protein [Neiella marina]|uniref:diguanylate cyclase n=1 Tax=Neiella marina TaxID=508461 RepID=A0A8J2XQJ4_9GAMM|nr:GGDEF domain-containing protein [Neiella marina]GGA85148.1 GGDEF domain-containing protein [Neiella marina]
MKESLSAIDGSARLLNLEKQKRIFLINAFTAIGAVASFVFGSSSLFGGMLVLGTVLICAGFVGCANLVFLAVRKNVAAAANVMGGLIITLSTALMIGGGYQNTGPYWVFPLVSVAMFVNNFRIGLLYAGLFLGFCLYLLFYPDNPLLLTDYSNAASIRFVAALSSILLLCLSVQYSQEQSQKQIRMIHQQLTQAATTDALTSLHNRRYIYDHHIDKDRFLGSIGGGGALLLVDVDHFKRINDDMGHDAGDIVLQVVARHLREAIRDEDIIARWGGEEFLVILPNVTLSKAYQRAEALRQRIEMADITIDGQPCRVTISVGVADIGADDNASNVIKLADERLYRAKKQGRNCVVY